MSVCVCVLRIFRPLPGFSCSPVKRPAQHSIGLLLRFTFQCLDASIDWLRFRFSFSIKGILFFHCRRVQKLLWCVCGLIFHKRVVIFRIERKLTWSIFSLIRILHMVLRVGSRTTKDWSQYFGVLELYRSHCRHLCTIVGSRVSTYQHSSVMLVYIYYCK